MKRTQRVLGLFAVGLATLSAPLLSITAEASEAPNATAVAPTGDAHIPDVMRTQFYHGQDSSVKEFPFIIGVCAKAARARRVRRAPVPWSRRARS